MQISFKGSKVLVAGGSRGIGRSIALAFAAEGAAVAICARDAKGLDAAATELRRRGGTVYSMSCDLAEASAASRFVTQAAHALDGIDILVNNASGLGVKDDESGWRASIDVDLMATVRATQTAIPFMEKGGGVIINISSISGLKAVPRTLPYAAVKAALVNYTMSQGLALASKRIRVNAIAPGAIEFPGGVWDNRKTSDPQLYQRTLSGMPWGRFGKPEEIAQVALFLASEMGSWVTGQTIVVDGGQSLA
ncbi:SDR family oxidoreductase [Nordella sp. HKS 07]|uniref:SDR family NAD(P)-dependent oxidoreductase n=1 Tax=Nordella sp. HKS 07 TaxID=2712222 RepID=UPI0013E19DFF|nr:SDR family NAD(P)-dependent oxidoreductase [Nordella sp. HKS 07]QIG47223.1 SDR family oxidoreductase [Nordella sp. HKS 07]